MSKTFLLLIFLFICHQNNYAQRLSGSEHHFMYYENDARFWEDPDGIIYSYDQIWVPDKTGDWIFFKVDSLGTRQDIFIHTINCLPSLDGRSKAFPNQDFTLYPNACHKYFNV